MSENNSANELRAQLPKIPEKTYTNIYGIKDIKFGFVQMLQYDNDLIALREFADNVNKFGTPINRHPEDYEIHKLGTWCHQSGEIVQDIKFLGTAISYIDEAQRKAYQEAVLQNVGKK
jgi:hypothetical protein